MGVLTNLVEVQLRQRCRRQFLGTFVTQCVLKLPVTFVEFIAIATGNLKRDHCKIMVEIGEKSEQKF